MHAWPRGGVPPLRAPCTVGAEEALPGSALGKLVTT